MIQEARRLPAAMVIVAGAFISFFVLIAVATVVTVLGSDRQGPPEVGDLPFPAGIAVVDRQLTCSPDICDGEASVVESPGMGASATLTMIEARLRNRSWEEKTCAGSRCLGQGDLRVRLAVWSDLGPDSATAAMRSHLMEREVDQQGFVFIHLFRCGVLAPCE